MSRLATSSTQWRPGSYRIRRLIERRRSDGCGPVGPGMPLKRRVLDVCGVVIERHLQPTALDSQFDAVGSGGPIRQTDGDIDRFGSCCSSGIRRIADDQYLHGIGAGGIGPGTRYGGSGKVDDRVTAGTGDAQVEMAAGARAAGAPVT